MANLLTLHGGCAYAPAIWAPPISLDTPASVTRVCVRGQPSHDALLLLEALGSSRALEVITFEFCSFTNAIKWSRDLKLKLRAETLEFRRCSRPSWALMHLAQPATVMRVSLWCCDDDMLPSADMLKGATHRAFWNGLNSLAIVDVPKNDVVVFGRVDLSDVLSLCTSLEELHIDSMASTVWAHRVAEGALPSLRVLRLWAGDRTHATLDDLLLASPGLLERNVIDASFPPPDDDVAASHASDRRRDELARDVAAIQDLADARIIAAANGGALETEAKTAAAHKVVASSTDSLRAESTRMAANLALGRSHEWVCM